MLKITKLITEHQTVQCANINLITGSNNTGKSTLLREIEDLANIQFANTAMAWLDSATMEVTEGRSYLEKLMPKLFSASSYEMIKDLNKLKPKFLASGYNNGAGFYTEGFYNQAVELKNDRVELVVSRSQSQPSTSDEVYSFIVRKSFAHDYCADRLQDGGVYEAKIDSILADPSDKAGYFWRNREVFSKIADHIASAFSGTKIGFDNLVQTSHPIRIMPDEVIGLDPTSNEAAELWAIKSPTLAAQGDGIRAYYKILTTLLDDSYDVILLDEPEAFLHPPQRRDLGRAVTKLISNTSKQIFIVTHDSEFLRGVLDTRIETNLIYLKNIDNIRTIHPIRSQELNSLSGNATFNSNILNERILNSFFYKKTIICESENDRVIYEYAAARYHWELFQEVNFISPVGGGGKQFATAIFAKLRSCHVNTALLLDIDYLFEGDLSIIDDMQVKAQASSFRSDLLQLIGSQKHDDAYKQNKKRFKSIGREYLVQNHSNMITRFDELISNLAVANIYVVSIGEIESFFDSDKNNIDLALEKINIPVILDELSSYLENAIQH